MQSLETAILDIIQDGFPLVERPFFQLAEQLKELGFGDASEQTVFDAVESLRNFGTIRRIGGVYDSRKMGYTSRLCCGKVPEATIESFAEVVEKEPSITHNYIRSHEFNVWFTVIGKCQEEIEGVVASIVTRTSLSEVHILNAKKMFKINTVMKKGLAGKDASQNESLVKQQDAGQTRSLPEDTLRKCREILFGDLPHTLTPYAAVAELMGSVSESDVLTQIREDLIQKKMRRFGAIIRHQKAGFAENAMVVFDVASEVVDNAGKSLAEEDFVSHCYVRDGFAGFPYSLYAMVHGETAATLNSSIEKLAKKISCENYKVLYSLRELKKTSFKYL